MYIYLSFVLYFTLMPIISALPFILDHPYVPMNMTPFIDVTHGRGDFVRQIALNIIMTVPFGFLLPLTDHERRSYPSSARSILLGLLRVLFLTFLLSFTIETLQPLLHSFRSADITDLITNVLGGLLGYLLVGEPKTEEIVKGGQWDDPSVAATAEAYADFASKGYFSETIASNVWPAGQNQELAMGTAAMYLNGSWLPNEVKDMAGDDFVWGCFSYPALEGGTDGVDAANYGAQVLAINKDSQKAEDAFKLICYITQGEFDKMLSELSIGIPADSNNTEWPALISCVKPVMDSTPCGGKP